jgi:hypothetical protein
MMNWKGFGRKRSWPNFKIRSRQSSGDNAENHENSLQDCQSSARDLNPGSTECKTLTRNHSFSRQFNRSLLCWGCGGRSVK